MSPLLHAFYVDYAAWLASDAPPHYIFTRCNGLCSDYKQYKRVHDTHPFVDERVELANLQRSFQEAGLHFLYPFNNGSSDEHALECENDQVHLNPRRIEWVRKHAATEHDLT